MKSEVLPIEGIDYVEIYVGNAKQASYFYQNGFGFTPIAFAGPETGVKDKTSYLLQQGDIRLLLTTGLNPDHPISRFVLTHGDGVADIALRVKDTEWTYKEAIKRGAKGKRKSQIQEYLDYFKGAGVQHLAISTDNLIATVTRLQQRGIEFLNTPDSYYAELPKRVGGISERIDDLKKLRILVDKDEKGYMLQIFTKPLQDRPTLFFELIQRRGSESFGKGNFKALFESIEQEQAKRGNL